MNKAFMTLVITSAISFGAGIFVGIQSQKSGCDQNQMTSSDRDELAARRLVADLGNHSMTKAEALVRFCDRYMSNEKELPGGWSGHALLDNPHGIEFYYLDSSGLEASEKHSWAEGDALKVVKGEFAWTFDLSASESEGIYYFFYGE